MSLNKRILKYSNKRIVTKQCICIFNFFPRYKQHKTDFEVIPKERPISLPCRVNRCACKSYNFVPLNGTQPIRCRCKHFADQHSPATGFLCNMCKCTLINLYLKVTAITDTFL